MSLREILLKIVDAGNPFLLADNQADWEAGDLLKTLSEMRLKTNAYLQPGLYIAEINESGYLGRVLYKVKTKGDR